MNRAAPTKTGRPAFLWLGLGLLVLPVAPLGQPPRAFADLDAAIASGVSRRVYPGAVVIVGRSNTILHARGFGQLDWTRGSRQPSPDSTLYDLASLTKVVATTSAAMLLVDRSLPLASRYYP